MNLDRRRLLGISTLAGLTSFAPPLVASTLARAEPPSIPADAALQAALLLPLTGASADLAASMARAAVLAQPSEQKRSDFLVFDTGDGVEGAGLAAQRAVAAGAGLILGPLFAPQVATVVSAAAGRPVLTFSNDASLVGTGAFLLGVTASQSVSAILNYARSRGVRRVALIATADRWSQQSEAAAREISGRIGVTLFRMSGPDASGAVDFASTLATACQGTAPDAVLFSQSDALSATLGARVVETGVQILGPSTWADAPSGLLGSVDGAWIAAPDPAAFTPFARAYETRHSSGPGLLAGLAFDGAGIVRRLRSADRLTRDGLLAPEGFSGVLGALRFTADGRCSRTLAIQVAGNGALRTVASAEGG